MLCKKCVSSKDLSSWTGCKRTMYHCFMATISEALAIAVQHHQAGRLQAAEQVYRQILAVEPNQPDAIHLLGVIASRLGRPEVAVQYIERAIQLRGSDGAFHYNLGNALLAQGRPDEAIACFQRAWS